MNSLRQLYDHLSWRQRLTILATVVAVMGGLFALQYWNTERKFKPLFSAMAADDAGAVITKLKSSNIEYRLADGGATILVEESRVAEVRLQLASAGLPQTGRIGYELFDQANFGASEFTEQVNYHRAIEGELERSVMSLREVERARVHLTMSKDSLYTEARQPAKASILVKLRTGAQLSAQNISAITQLAASAVPGLKANQVTLVDTNGNLLSRPRSVSLNGEDPDGNEGVLEYRKTIEHDIQAKIAQTLEPLLGTDHFRIGVSTEIDLTSGDQSEELFDPEKAVIASSQTTQDVPAGGVVQAGVPGTSSNLPRPTASQASAAASTTNYGRRTENVNYQTSRTVRHTKLEQGALKRMSVSILVDHNLRYDNGKPVVEAPKPEKLQVIKDVVAAAVGLNTMRGDQLVVEAFPFESTLAAQPLAPDAPSTAPSSAIPLPAWLQKLLGENFKLQDPLGLVGGVVGGFLLILVGGAWWFLKGRKKGKVAITGQLAAGGKRDAGSLSADAERSMEARLAEQVAEQDRKDAEAILALKIPAPSTKKTDVLTKHISGEIKKDPTAMAHVVRSWLNGEYQR
ncbi:MAG: flagellar basal-body MS-ring/collar protein FliF [Acidobacteriota bacterium]